MLGKLPHKLAGIHQRILHRYFKHRANISFNNLLQRRLSVRRPPDRAGNLVQREERRVRHGHHHRLSGKNPGSDRGTASYIHGPHPRFLMPPNPTPKHPCETLAAALALAAQIHRLPQIWPVPIPYRGQKTECCAATPASPKPDPHHQCGSLHPAAKDTTPARALNYAPPPSPTLPQTVCRALRTLSHSCAHTKFHP